MPSKVKKCSICTGDPAKKSEIDSLLEQEEPLSSIATITGVGKYSIFRHNKHRKSRQNGQESRLHRLYERIEKSLTRAERKGDTRAAVEYSRQLTNLRRQMTQQEAAAPKPVPASPWGNSIANWLGYSPQGLDREFVRDAKMCAERHQDDDLLLAAIAFVISRIEDGDLPESVAAAVGRFVTELAATKEHIE